MSCVDVFYSVKVQQHMTKDESEDNSIVAMALIDTIDNENVNEEGYHCSHIKTIMLKFNI